MCANGYFYHQKPHLTGIDNQSWEYQVPWHPAQRPRLPRVRAQYRALRTLNAPYELPPSQLSAVQLEHLRSFLIPMQEASFSERLIAEAEFQYRFIRINGTLPKGAVRYQLRMLAHHCWHILTKQRDHAHHAQLLANAVRNLDRYVKALLLSMIAQVSGTDLDAEYLLYSPEGLDARLIYMSALLADQQLDARGDYKNNALASSIATLVFAWALAMNRLPIVARKNPRGFGAAGSSIASSDCAKFIFAFFEIVDPHVSQVTITDVLDQRLRAIRKLGITSLSDHLDDVVTHLHSNL